MKHTNTARKTPLKISIVTAFASAFLGKYPARDVNRQNLMYQVRRLLCCLSAPSLLLLDNHHILPE